MTLSGPSSLFRHAACQRYASAPAVRKALTRSTNPAEDAACMARALDLVMTRSSSQAVCCQLAASTSFRAFEMLCAKCEGRGLVFVHTDDPEQKLGEVYYDRDPSWQHEMVSGLLSKIVAFDLGQLAGKEALELLGSGASPHVALSFRNKEPDFAWIPADLAAIDAAPSVVLEVAVFNESETELLNAGSEWLDLPDVQAAILVKVFHKDSPINDCPENHAGVWMKHRGQKRFTGYKEFGGASSCTQAGLEAFLIDIPWKVFFHGTQAHIPGNVLATVFKLDMWDIQRGVRTVYKATRQKIEAATAVNAAPPPAQGRLEFIADRVKQRRRTC